MPSPDTVLAGLTAIANEWRWLAITWHVLLGGAVVLLLAGWRPSVRLIGCLLVAPLLSVSVTAWLADNPFNATVFAILAGTLLPIAARFSRSALRGASPVLVAMGVAFVAFGATYPHFVRAESWLTYLYASSFGTLPCPTLAISIGSTLILSNLRSTSWSTPLVLTGLVYGAIGAFRLGVALDLGLLLASGVLAVTIARDRCRWRSIRADQGERRRALSGDRLISKPLGTLTHAITIAGNPRAVWPWLIQMGAGRAGWYSYDFLDNGGRRSSAHLEPELQTIEIGAVFPALPGVTEGFTVLALEPYKSLILGWPAPNGEPLVTWAFVLEEWGGRSTRLIVRARAGRSYRFHGLPAWLSVPLARLVHFVMQRKQLLGIARRVESANGSERQRASIRETSCPASHPAV